MASAASVIVSVAEGPDGCFATAADVAPGWIGFVDGGRRLVCRDGTVIDLA